MKKRICILYTGGTIGMVPSEKGYVPSSGAFLDLLRAIPDLYWADMPAWDVVEFDPLLDSANGTRSEAPLLSGTKIMTASSSSTARTRWRTLRRRFPSCWKTSQSP